MISPPTQLSDLAFLYLHGEIKIIIALETSLITNNKRAMNK